LPPAWDVDLHSSRNPYHIIFRHACIAVSSGERERRHDCIVRAASRCLRKVEKDSIGREDIVHVHGSKTPFCRGFDNSFSKPQGILPELGIFGQLCAQKTLRKGSFDP
jgi:hypothetical protein